jgi:hypothetical protein
MSYSFKPVQILNDVGASLGVSPSYLEWFRQGVEMSSFVGWDDADVRKELVSMIRAELSEFWDLYTADDSEISIGEPRPRAYYDSAVALGFLNLEGEQ